MYINAIMLYLPIYNIIVMSKTLVLYVFHQYNERVKHFIQNAIFYDENIDFLVISNNKNNVFEVPPYVKTMYRDNIGFFKPINNQ